MATHGEMARYRSALVADRRDFQDTVLRTAELAEAKGFHALASDVLDWICNWMWTTPLEVKPTQWAAAREMRSHWEDTLWSLEDEWRRAQSPRRAVSPAAIEAARLEA